MRIAIKSGGTETVLCDGPDRSVGKSAGPSGLAITSTGGRRIAERLHAEYVDVQNTYNIRTTVSFAVRRLMSNYESALAWAVSHASSCLRFGTLECHSPSLAAAVTLANAGLVIAKLDVLGATATVQYDIVGGQLS